MNIALLIVTFIFSIALVASFVIAVYIVCAIAFVCGCLLAGLLCR